MFIRIDDAIHSDIKETNYHFEAQEKFLYFGPTDTVNIFVGANNSGKSRFLRGLIKSNKIVLVNNLDFRTILEEIQDISNTITIIFRNNDNPQFSYNYDNRAEKEIDESHKWLMEHALASVSGVTFDSDYFSSLVEIIELEWLSDEKNFYNSLLRRINEILLLLKITHLYRQSSTYDFSNYKLELSKIINIPIIDDLKNLSFLSENYLI